MSQATEKHAFQAEIQQLLDIVIHSLYTDKEIFIRELISNAADACEKLRFQQTSGQVIHQADTDIKISIATDDKANTITITDTGIGMNRDELVKNLGTIAHSGSKAFLQQMKEGKEKPDANLIGQFGVGFYSAFMVAEEVQVHSRSFDPDQTGHIWTSQGSGTYEIEEAPEWPRGTRIFVKLKADDKEFSEAARVESIVKQYSNFVPFPIELNGELVNKVSAIWTRSKGEVKDEEYKEFYHYIGHDHEDPLTHLHFAADAPLSIQSLIYVPSKNMENMGVSRSESEVHLYCRKVLIQSKAEGLFPDWLRFLKGVVDSEDLPLNISRESMQDSALLQKLNKVLTTRFLKHLDELSKKDSDTFEKVYDQYHRFLKEGVATDFTHRDNLAKLLRFESSSLEKGQKTSLKEYIERMPEGQTEIYYLLASGRDAAEESPYLEVFKSKHFEVLYLFDPIDELVMDHLGRFDEKTLAAAEKADLAIEDDAKLEKQLSDDEGTALAQWVKEKLGDKVEEVRVSSRLVDSPAVVLDSDKTMTSGMRRFMKSMNQEAGLMKLDMELNPRHPMLSQLHAMKASNELLAVKVAEQLFDNARLAAGVVEDPKTLVKQLNQLLEQVLEKGK
ncbi:MAG: molecular chaperone HtpG [Verrucomicrobiota bacterium]|nr:molecular chaperone HtpG [Verrucomicrobiota bacterium]